MQMMGDYSPDDMYLLVPDQVGYDPGMKTRKVLCPLLSGLLSASQPRWIPFRTAPLTIELEVNPLVNQFRDVMNGSVDWSLEDAQIKVDL